MTTPDERRQEFFEKCLNGDERPGAIRIDGTADQKRKADRFRDQSRYHRIAADDHLEGQAKLLAIREGYYAMFHKANEALALAGFEPKSHQCTLLGLRGIFDAPEPADTLRRAGDERTSVDYGLDPDDPELVEFADPNSFVESVADPFISDVDSLIESKL